MMRWCEDIGMFSFDRPITDVPATTIEGSCVHKTEFCTATCYNNKLYKLYPKMLTRDVKNEQYWQNIKGEDVRIMLSRKKHQTKRARFMTRGEAIKEAYDVTRVYNICMSTPDTNWWMPTRAWRDKGLKFTIESRLFPLSNLAVLASTDPTTSEFEDHMLHRDGWSTMYYGLDGATETLGGVKRFRCPKTFGHVKGACEACINGCFKPITKREQVHVHLKQH